MLTQTATADTADLDEIRATNLARTREWFAQIETAAATNTHWKLLPNILVDLQNASITFKAEATGLNPNEVVEFFLIGQRSGNAYESIAVALAEPGDIATAIKMLGVPTGLHPDPAALRFWPQGERVHMFFDQYHAAELLLDKRTGATASRSGFVFTASQTTEIDGTTVLSAQAMPPFSIAANYNETHSILDVPFRAPQSAVYSEQVQNPEIRFAPGQLLTVRITPENTDGTRRVQLLELHISQAQHNSTAPAADLRFTLKTRGTENILLPDAALDAFFAFIRDLVRANKDPFVELHLGPALPIEHAHAIAQLIDNMEDKDGLRVLPPPPDALYYRAFSPNEELRDRDNRIAHPWELHLSHTNTPVLVQINEEWRQGETHPLITTKDIPVTNLEDMSLLMEERRPGVNAVFVYAPREMHVGEIMKNVRHFQKTHPFVHIFMVPSPHDRTSGAAPAATSE
ncbi:MAG: hypothetical protein ACNA71_04350 [Kiritimatiellia bacterium]